MSFEAPEYLKSPDHLREYLQSQNIPLDRWNIPGRSKSVTELFQEIQDQDCSLVIENGELVRHTCPVFIDIKYSDKGIVYVCNEVIARSGQVRNLPATYSERGRTYENHHSTYARALFEEVHPSLPKSGLTLKSSSSEYIDWWQNKQDAYSYPGLQTFSLNYRFHLYLRRNQGIPIPFTLEEGENGTEVTHYNWSRDNDIDNYFRPRPLDFPTIPAPNS